MADAQCACYPERSEGPDWARRLPAGRGPSLMGTRRLVHLMQAVAA